MDSIIVSQLLNLNNEGIHFVTPTIFFIHYIYIQAAIQRLNIIRLDGVHSTHTVHIGPAHGLIANSMALKNRGMGLKISALGYIL